MATWTTPTTFPAGHLMTDTDMNTNIINNLQTVGQGWQAFTPTWAATGTAPVIGNGSLIGATQQLGKLTFFRISLIAGTTTTFGTGQYTFTGPSLSISGVSWRFTGWLRDLSAAAFYPIDAAYAGVATMSLWTPGSPSVIVTATAPVTLANTDQIHITGTYEAA